jgi:hypothetical protein
MSPTRSASSSSTLAQAWRRSASARGDQRLDDVVRGWHDALGVGDLRLGPQPHTRAVELDSFAEVLLVDRGKDVGLDDGERVDAARVVQLADDLA